MGQQRPDLLARQPAVPDNARCAPQGGGHPALKRTPARRVVKLVAGDDQLRVGKLLANANESGDQLLDTVVRIELADVAEPAAAACGARPVHPELRHHGWQRHEALGGRPQHALKELLQQRRLAGDASVAAGDRRHGLQVGAVLGEVEPAPRGQVRHPRHEPTDRPSAEDQQVVGLVRVQALDGGSRLCGGKPRAELAARATQGVGRFGLPSVQQPDARAVRETGDVDRAFQRRMEQEIDTNLGVLEQHLGDRRTPDRRAVNQVQVHWRKQQHPHLRASFLIRDLRNRHNLPRRASRRGRQTRRPPQCTPGGARPCQDRAAFYRAHRGACSATRRKSGRHRTADVRCRPKKRSPRAARITASAARRTG